MFVYKYQYINELEFIMPSNEYIDYCKKTYNQSASDLKIEIDQVKGLFKEEDWDGTGELGVIWVPPFFWNDDDHFGVCIWHVRQDRLGISFIASPVEISFGCLSYDPQNTLINPSLTGVSQYLNKNIDSDVKEAKNYVDSIIKNMPDDEAKDLCNYVAQTVQSKILTHFEKYLEELYLIVLNQRYISHNQAVNIKDGTIRINTLNRSDDFRNMNEYEKRRLIILDFMSPLYKSFQKENFGEKIKILNSSLNFKGNETETLEIKKHKEIRNCIQHHHAALTSTALENCGCSSIELKNMTLRVNDRIYLSPEDIEKLKGIIQSFVENIGNHCDDFFI